MHWWLYENRQHCVRVESEGHPHSNHQLSRRDLVTHEFKMGKGIKKKSRVAENKKEGPQKYLCGNNVGHLPTFLF